MLKSNSSKAWGTLADGTNQGVKHFNNYWTSQPDRIPSLAKRLGVDAGDFANTVDGFENFTKQAQRVVDNGLVNDVGGGKVYHYLATYAKNGVIAITYDGKLQTMMPSNLKYFNKQVK